MPLRRKRQPILSDYMTAERPVRETTVKGYPGSVEGKQLYTALCTERDRYGSTAVHKAARRGQTEAVQCYLAPLSPSQRFNLLKIQSNQGYTALHWAACKCYTAIAALILNGLTVKQCFYLIKIQGDLGNTAVHAAAYRGCSATINALFDHLEQEQQFDLIHVQNGRGDTALHSAVYGGYPEVVKNLLSALTPKQKLTLLCTETGEGYTALHWAAIRRHTRITEHLLSNLTSVQQLTLLRTQNASGRTALHYAAGGGHTNVIELLLNCLTSEDQFNTIFIQDSEGRTALQNAICGHHTYAIKMLLQGLSSDQRLKLLHAEDSEGRTALYSALCGGHTDVLICLLESLSPRQQLDTLLMEGKDGRRALDLTTECDHVEAAAYLQGMISSAEAIVNSLNGIQKIPGIRESEFPRWVQQTSYWERIQSWRVENKEQDSETLKQDFRIQQQRDKIREEDDRIKEEGSIRESGGRNREPGGRNREPGGRNREPSGRTREPDGRHRKQDGRIREQEEENAVLTLVTERHDLKQRDKDCEMPISDTFNQQSVPSTDRKGVTSRYLTQDNDRLAAEFFVDQVERFGITTFHQVAYENRRANLEQLLHAVEDPYDVLQLQDNRGFTPLHVAAHHNHDACLKIMLSSVNREQGFSLLKLQDRVGRNVLHNAIENRSIETINVIFDQISVADSAFEMLVSFIDATDGQGRTAMGVALENEITFHLVDLFLDNTKNISFLESETAKFATNCYPAPESFFYTLLLQRFVEFGTVRDVLKLFTTRNGFGRTILHQAARKDRQDVLRIAFSDLDMCSRSKLCQVTDATENNLLHYAASSKTMTELVVASIEPDKLFEILTHQNQSKESAIHIIGWHQPIQSTETLIDFCLRNDNFFTFLHEQDKNGQTILHVFAYNNAVRAVRSVLLCLEPTEVMEVLLCKTESTRSTVLHILAEKGFASTIFEILCLVNKSDRLELLQQQDVELCSAFHCLVSGLTKNSVKNLEPILALLEQLNQDERTSLLQQTNKYGETVLHSAVEYSSSRLFETFHTSLPEAHKADLLKVKESRQGFSPLIRAIVLQKRDTVKFILDYVTAAGRDDIAKLTDLKGWNAFDWSQQVGFDNILLANKSRLDIANEDKLYGEPNHFSEKNVLDVGELDDSVRESCQGMLPLPPSVRNILTHHVSIARHSLERVTTIYKLPIVILKERYRKETTRLQTYAYYVGDVMPKHPLAAAGFISMRKGDEVVCVWCGLGLYGFEEYVNVTAIHLAYSYHQCKFFFNDKENVPMLPESKVSSLHAQQMAPATNTLDSGYGEDSLSSAGSDSQSRPPHDSHNLLTVARSDSEVISEAGVHEGTMANNFDPELAEQRYDHFNNFRYTIDSPTMKCIVEKVHSITGKYRDMANELNRRQTFLDYGWPSSAAREWAAAGFFFKKQTADSQILVCAFCGGTAQDVSEKRFTEKSAMLFHLKTFPGCPFTQGNKVDESWSRKTGSGVNNPLVLGDQCWSDLYNPSDQIESSVVSSELETLGISIQHAKYSELAVLDRRISTFLTFPHDHPKNSEELAISGFFFEGNGYSVICFFCAVVADDWSITEDVWQRHARSSCSCQFVIEMKSQDFIRATIEQFGVYVRPPEENKLSQVTVRMLRPRMDSPVVQLVLALIGEDKNIVRTVLINRLKKLGPDYTTAQELLTDVLAMKVPESKLTTKKRVLPKLKSKPSANFQAENLPSFLLEELEEEITPEPESPQVMEADQRDQVEEEMEEELASTNNADSDLVLGMSGSVVEIATQMKSQLMCKICISDIVQIIFLPCGHFVCCTACAAAMKECPLCRQEIRATVKANF